MAADDYALVVGINRYPGLSNSLQGPENDADNFARWLTDPAKGAVPQANVTLIQSKGFTAPADPLDARPATTEVDSALERLIRQGQNNGGVAGRRLYIFLAGHGFAPNIEDAALLMANVNFLAGTTGHHISGRSYANWFRESGLFQEIVLIMDCCRDGMPDAPVRKPLWEPIRNPRGAKTPYLFAFATEWLSPAREGPMVAGGPVQGYFSTALLDALDGGAADANGDVTSASVKGYLLNFFRTMPGFKGLPEPRVEYDDANQVMLARGVPAVRTPVRITFTPANAPFAATYTVFDGNLQPVVDPKTGATLDNLAGANPWDVDLPMGQYTVARSFSEKQRVEAVGKGRIDVSV